MSSETFPSSDLRRSAMESKRHHDQKAKWAYGSRSSYPAKYDSVLQPTHVRPAHPDPECRTYNLSDREHAKAKSGTKNILRQDADDAVHDFQSDSSSDESVNEPNAAGDEGVFYSFDAPNGPAAGEHLLSVAINKAVERFEVQETQKIEKEYEFVPMEEEQADGDGYIADDDFEIVDPIRL